MNENAGSVNPLRRQEFFFWCFAVAALLAFLGRNSLLGPEAFYAESAREINETGALWPLQVNFSPAHRLPVLSCWGVAAAFAAGGFSEFAARLPVALAGLLLLGGVRSLGRSLFDRRTALLAGWLTLGSYGFLYWSRSVAGYVPGCAAVVWAVAWYYRGSTRFGFWKSLVFYLLIFAGAIAHNLYFLLLPGALLLPGLMRTRRGMELFSPRGLPALLLAIGIPTAWFWYSERIPIRLVVAEVNQLFDGGIWNALKTFSAVLFSGCERSEPVYAGVYEIPRILLPWSLMVAAAVAGAVARFRSLPPVNKSLLQGTLLLFLVCACPASCRWPDFLPVLPFLALAGASALLCDGMEKWNRSGVFLTRSAIVLMAALGAVSPVALPVWSRLLKIELPVVVLVVWPVAGILVLLLMLLDSHPAQPLYKLTGLPTTLASTIVGGTLATVCLISFVVPSLRELRTEKQFLLTFRNTVANFAPESILFIGDRDDAAALLFYVRKKSAISIVHENDSSGFSRVIDGKTGSRIAIVTRYRRERELKFLRQVAEACKLKLDIDAPDSLESSSGGWGNDDKRLAFWLITPPFVPAIDIQQSTGKGKSI